MTIYYCLQGIKWNELATIQRIKLLSETTQLNPLDKQTYPFGRLAPYLERP